MLSVSVNVLCRSHFDLHEMHPSGQLQRGKRMPEVVKSHTFDRWYRRAALKRRGRRVHGYWSEAIGSRWWME